MADPVTATPTPPLIWPDGRRMVRHEMVREVAGPMIGSVRNVSSGHPAQGLTPERLARLLRESEDGDATAYLELAEEMEEKDLHYLAVISTRKRAVAQLPVQVIAAGESPDEEADAALVRDWLERDTLETELFDILDAIGKGFSVAEIVWNLSDRQWLPERIEWRDPRWFEFDRVDGNTIMLRTNAGPKPLSAAKYIVHKHPAKSGLPIRAGLARAAAWSYLFKNYAMKDWVSFLDAFGLPMRVGRYDNGTAEKDIRFLMNAVAQLGSDAAAVYPKSMDIEFIDGKQGTGPSDLWKALAEYLDQQVSKAVLGQTASTDAVAGGLGSGQSNVHNDVRGDIERADAKLISATLNRDLVRPLVILNRGERARYPRIVIGRPEEHDIKALTGALQVLVPMGLKVGVKTVRDRVGIPEPDAGDELLIAPSNAGALGGAEGLSGSHGAEAASTNFLGLLRGQKRGTSKEVGAHIAASVQDRTPPADPVDRLADEYLGDWERHLSPAMNAIEDLLGSSRSVDEVEVGLAALADTLDVADLTNALARAAFTARLAGIADIDAAQQGGD